MWLAVIIALDEILYGNISNTGFGENLSFLLKSHWFWELSLVYVITWVILIWFENSFACGLQLSFSWMSSYMEICEGSVLGEIVVFCSKITDFENWISIVYAITWVNLIWFEKSFTCGLQLSLSWMSFIWKYFKNWFWGKS